MPRPAGYYWVKSATDSRLQIVLSQGDGVVWLFGQDRGQYIAGEEPEIFKGQGLSLEVITGPLEPPASQPV
jgi:hypothetical protein